jgi:hypothetical protein
VVVTDGVCFTCCRTTELVPGHSTCPTCHDETRCRRQSCLKKRRPAARAATAPRFRDQCLDALAVLGGRATTGDIANVTGLTGAQVGASLRATKGVSYIAPASKANGLRGTWLLETAPANDLAGIADFDAVTA